MKKKLQAGQPAKAASNLNPVLGRTANKNLFGCQEARPAGNRGECGALHYTVLLKSEKKLQ